MSTLDEILGGNPDSVEEPVVEDTVTESETTVEEPAEEPVTEEVIEEPVKEPPAAPTAAQKDVPLNALLDERDKRQKAQQELAELRKEKEQPAQDVWSDPEAYINTAVTEARQELTAEFTEKFIAMSMSGAAYRHDDFDAMKEAFATAVQENPALANQALASPDPGEYIYATGKQFAELDAVGGDLDSLREKIRQELMAEMNTEKQQSQQKLLSVPESLTDKTSASAPREKIEGGPTPLANIFSNR